ncbi:hypothetical protein Tco_0665296 [Tanacetum coccineum]
MNTHTDALSKLVALSFEHIGKDILVEVIKEKSILQSLEVSQAKTYDTWMAPIFNYLFDGILPPGKVESLSINTKPSCTLSGTLSYIGKPSGIQRINALDQHRLAQSSKTYTTECMTCTQGFAPAKVVQMGYYWPTFNHDTEAELNISRMSRLHQYSTSAKARPHPDHNTMTLPSMGH